jgi:hypothetical protein
MDKGRAVSFFSSPFQKGNLLQWATPLPKGSRSGAGATAPVRFFIVPQVCSEKRENYMMPETSPFDAAIAELEERIRSMQVTLDTLRAFRAHPEGAPPTPPANAHSGKGEVQHDSFFGMTIADAARKFLGIVKRTKSTAEIASALEAGGLKHASKDFQTTIRSTLAHKEEFLRVNGDWGLTEWYPGKGRGRQAATPKKKAKGRKVNRKRTASTGAAVDRKTTPPPENAEPPSTSEGPQARIEKYRAKHPTATPRAIADALGLKIQVVALILGKLSNAKRAA